MAVKDSEYFLAKLQASVTARIPAIVFRLWDPYSTLLAGIAKRCAEIVALGAQDVNDWYIDSARGAKLDRRLGSEGIPRIAAKAADDGTITLTRQTEYTSTITYPIGSLTFSLPPDPSVPSSSQPTFTNTQAVTIGPGLGTSWTVTAKATRGGADTNLQAGQRLLLTTPATYFDTASVDAVFTTGADAEEDDGYRRRAKSVRRARARGTDDALLGAAFSAGAAFAYAVETPGATPPVVIYAANATGALPSGLRTNILLALNGNGLAEDDPDFVPMVRAKGIVVDVQLASVVTFDFSIGLVLQPWVVDGPGGNLLTALRADIAAAIAAYVAGLNELGNPDRVMRLNRVKDIVMSFRARGVLDVVDETFLPAASTTLTTQQMAVAGTFTWL